MIVSSFVKIYAFYVQIFLCTCSGILCHIALIPISPPPPPPPLQKKVKISQHCQWKISACRPGDWVGGGGVVTKILGPSRSQLK